MASFFFRPVKRDLNTPAGGTEREFRSKVVGNGAQGQAKRGSVFADKLARLIPLYSPRGK